MQTGGLVHRILRANLHGHLRQEIGGALVATAIQVGERDERQENERKQPNEGRGQRGSERKHDDRVDLRQVGQKCDLQN